jgi:hypothetical protein
MLSVSSLVLVDSSPVHCSEGSRLQVGRRVRVQRAYVDLERVSLTRQAKKCAGFYRPAAPR